MQAWTIYALLSAIFAAGVAIFGKLGISKVDSTLATTLRAVIMAVFLFFITLTFGKFSALNTIDNRALKFIILSGLSGAISWLFYFLALKTGPATGVAVIDRTSVVFVLVFAALFLSEGLNIKSVGGIILMVIGATLVVL
jgi:bacterial/archaeal transporter family protein